MNPETPTPQPQAPAPDISPNPAHSIDPSLVTVPSSASNITSSPAVSPTIEIIPALSPNTVVEPSAAKIQPTVLPEGSSKPGSILQPISSESDIMREREENTPVVVPPTPATPSTPVEPFLKTEPASASDVKKAQREGGFEKELSTKRKIIKWVIITTTGAILPIIASYVTSIIYKALVATGTFSNQAVDATTMVQAVPYVSWVIVAIVGMIVLKKFSVKHPYFISLAALSLVDGIRSLLSTHLHISVIYDWSYFTTYITDYRFQLALLVMGVSGAVSMLLLVFITNVIGKRWSSRIKVILLIIVILLPTAAGFISTYVSSFIDKPISKTILLSGYTATNSPGLTIGDGWPVLPTVVPGFYNENSVKQCIDEVSVYNGTKSCYALCVESFGNDKVCTSIRIASGIYDEATMHTYEYSDGECDISYLQKALMGTIRSDAMYPGITKSNCEVVNSPSGKTVYRQTQQGVLPAQLYYFIQDKSLVVIQETGIVGLDTDDSVTALKHVLAFTDKFEVVSK